MAGQYNPLIFHPHFPILSPQILAFPSQTATIHPHMNTTINHTSTNFAVPKPGVFTLDNGGYW
jgi:hypothetical protein